jgi:hypothetical protein
MTAHGKRPPTNGTAEVDAFMATLDHPQRAEIAAIRAIIIGASPQIAERIKWKVPSFYYRADLAAFHLRATGCVQLVLVFPHGLVADPSGLLEGAWPDRRLAKFYDLADVHAKQAALAGIVNAWVALEEQAA